MEQAALGGPNQETPRRLKGIKALRLNGLWRDYGWKFGMPCARLPEGEGVPTDTSIAVVFPRRMSVAGFVFLGLFFSSQGAWAQARPASPFSQPQQSSGPQPVSEPQQTSEEQNAAQLKEGCEPKQVSSNQQQPASTSEPPHGDLTQVSIENLMNMEVTSASKKEQRLSRVAAAIFVITQEDIRRSGATNIPDLLRMVPGLEVAQINANTWAISARGFNEQFSAKLLVMIDGRSVYTPTFGGVYWDTIDVPLEDIERIEVVRGPGGTVWGVNAVNGVINLITKGSAETRGGLVVAGGGNVDEEFGTVQYGGGQDGKTDYRAYVKYMNTDHSPGLVGGSAGDGWDMVRGGFRVDSPLSGNDKLTVEGNVYGGQEGQGILGLAPGLITQEFGTLAGGDVEAFWNHKYSETSASTLQVSFDRYEHKLPFKDDRNTLDASFQHYFSWGERQAVIWGADYRFTNHDSNSEAISYAASDTTRQLFSTFLQDEIVLIPSRLYFTLGTRLEHNDYNGFDLLPSARMAWQPDQKNTLWIAVSRAERTPSSGDIADEVNGGEMAGPGGVPIQIVLSGDPNFKNETLLAYEAGYRAAITSSFSLDLSAYFNVYKDLRTLETGALTMESTPAPPHFVLPLFFSNEMHGESHGLEISGNWKPTARWTIKSGYAFEQVDVRLDATSDDTVLSSVARGGSPEHSVQLQSHVDLGHAVTWDTSANFASRLPALGVPTRTRLETGLSWHFRKDISASLVGQNLLKDHELEYLNVSGLTQSSLLKRSAYFKVTWSF
jgi:iron complex outermembrane receptor protein